VSGPELEITGEFPDCLLPLFNPCRYKVMWGGRGSGKSWGVARALLLQCLKDPLRVLCAREIQRTVADSVHRLLADQVKSLGLDWFFTVQEASISGKNGSEFLFAGLRQQDAAKIKSFEGVDVAWVEEAQAVTKKSWDILIPTIRAEDSEIWVTFNPELDSDDTYQRFVVDPPPGAWVQKMTWADNPWFPEVLEQERISLLKRDKESHDHVWGGNCRTVVDGAIYAREVMDMIEQRRICNVPYDPMLKVHTVWDLGWNDQMSIGLVQKLASEVRIIEYIEDSHRTIAEYVANLKTRRYVWGKDWLPHDGAAKDYKSGKSAQEIMKALGRDPVIIPRGDVEGGIKAVRMMLPRLYMDKTRCARLADCLKRYRRAIPTTTNEPAGPLHDEYSHGADMVRGLAMSVEKMTNDDRVRPAPMDSWAPAVEGVM
jgi:phage terminase large subunit